MIAESLTAVATRPESPALALVAATGMLGLAWATGTRLARVLRLHVESGAHVVALGLGLGALSHLWLGLGALGWYRRDVAWVLAGAGLLAALVAASRALAGARIVARRLGALPPYERALAALLTLLGLCTLAGALVPPFAIDVLRHHLNVAKLFAATGGLVFQPIVLYAHPLGGEMFYLWGLLLSGPLAGKLVLAIQVLAAAAAVGVLAGRHAGPTGALHGALITLSITPVWYFAIEGKIDPALLMYVALALLGLDRWWSDSTGRALAEAGMFLGFAASAKLLGLYAIVAAGAVVAARVVGHRLGRRLQRMRWRRGAGARVIGAGVERARADRQVAALGACFAALLFAGAPWYLRTWWMTGDPIWPMLHPWVGGIDGSGAAHRDALVRLQARLSVGLDAGGFVRGLGAMLAGAPVLYGRALVGPLVLAGLPLLALGQDERRRALPLVGFALLYYAVWFPLDQQGRYLLPTMLALAGPAAVGLTLGRRASGGVCVGAAVLAWGAASTALAIWTLLGFAPAILRTEDVDDFLARRSSFHAQIREMNTRLPADAVVASDYAALFYLDRRSVWLDDFQAFVDYDRVDGAEGLYQALRRWHVSHLFLTGTAEATRRDGDRQAILNHEVATRCGTVVHRNRHARRVTSVTLDQGEPEAAVVVALAARCER